MGRRKEGYVDEWKKRAHLANHRVIINADVSSLGDAAVTPHLTNRTTIVMINIAKI